MNWRMRGRSAAAVVLAGGFLITAGCSSPATAGPTSAAPTASSTYEYKSILTNKYAGATLSFWGWDSLDFNKPVEKYVKDAAGITVEGRQLPAAKIVEQLKLAAQSNTLPDVYKVPTNAAIPALVAAGAVRDITDMVQPYRDLMANIAWDSCTVNGRVYCLPANSPAGGMFYRADVLAKYGVDPASLTTWDAFVAAAKQVYSKSGGKVSMLGFKDDFSNSTLINALVAQGHGVLIDGDLNVQVAPTSAEWQNVTKTFLALSQDGVGNQVTEWTPQWYQAIKDGSIAAFPEGTWFVETILQQAPDTKGKWAFEPFPAMVSGGDRYPSLGSAVIALSASSTQPEAGFELAKAWSIDPQGSLAIGLQELGISTVSSAALDSAYVKEPHPLFVNNQPYWLDATKAYTNITWIAPATTASDQSKSIFATDLPRLIKDRSSDAFLQQLAVDLRSQIKGAK